jgi:hypothetical protein
MGWRDCTEGGSSSVEDVDILLFGGGVVQVVESLWCVKVKCKEDKLVVSGGRKVWNRRKRCALHGESLRDLPCDSSCMLTI